MTVRVKAPGRVNIIGEHTDYNDGFVLPFAIDRYVEVEVKASKGFSLTSKLFGQTVRVEKNEKRGDWSDYVMGVVWALEEAGYKVEPFEMTIDSTLPTGAGLSSSAALEVASAVAIMKLMNHPIDPRELVQICVRAEREFVGVRCGVMDQFTAVFAKKDHAILLDTMTMNYEYVPLNLNNSEFVLIDSNVRHELASSEYNRRRMECETILKKLNKRSFREVTEKEISVLEPTLRRRAKHVFSENQRVLKMVEALRKNNLFFAGCFLYESHASLRDLYEVSCDEVDFIVGFLKGRTGVLGARIVGGGFGGSVLALVRKNISQLNFEELDREYRKLYGKSIRVLHVNSDNGVLFSQLISPVSSSGI
ncbi:galactokinase [Thermotoga sp. Ku-13t]|uniref:galactokinase n=1 Tax=Thermotoga sp. Ku-13t TaxID=1755813 RepID=UPI001F4A096E|nr:galactokinase [Thermotoga sp. Ku-13t]